jgi:ADP-dependent NAD(P)H-hydrate dehydratase / NAD(P)H-hydrate epimerase
LNTRDVFGRETVPVVTTAEAVAHDRSAHKSIPERALMENAGRALALITNALFPEGKIVGVSGKGHNGGDTEIALQALASWGRDVAHINISTADDVTSTLASAAVILDGILGTGSHGAPRERAAELISAIKQSERPVIAVDIPSGIDADSSAVHEHAVHAHATVTFGFPKIGMLFQPAREHCGRLIAVEIGFPPLDNFNAQLITPDWAAARLPQRKANANKGTSGRLLMLTGTNGMAGAAVIAGGAAVRAGAGLVRIVSSADNREVVQKTVPEATFFDRNGEIDYNGVTSIVAGPGMGANDDTRALLQAVFGKLPGVPALLDADALNVLAGNLEMLDGRPLVLTPHPKELSRLNGASVEAIVADPMTHARTFAEKTKAVVLLKGQPSVVAAVGQPLLINSVGSSDFAVAGMGDQLSGVIGAMLAAGLDARNAAAVGLFYSGRAGDIAQRGRALTPTDVTEHLAPAFADAGPQQSSLGLPFITFDQPQRW